MPSAVNSYQRFLEAADVAGLHYRELESGKRAQVQTPGHSDQDRGTSITYNEISYLFIATMATLALSSTLLVSHCPTYTTSQAAPAMTTATAGSSTDRLKSTSAKLATLRALTFTDCSPYPSPAPST